MEFIDEHRRKYEHLDDGEYYQKCMNGDFEREEEKEKNSWDNYEFSDEEYENGFYEFVQEMIEEEEYKKEEEEKLKEEYEWQQAQLDYEESLCSEEEIEETNFDDEDFDWRENEPEPLPPEFGDCEELEEYF